MKKSLITGLILLSLASCRDRQDENTLPAATQIGANTGGALVNGEVWVAKEEFPNSQPGGNHNYYTATDGVYSLILTMRNYNNTNNSIRFFITENADFSEKTYILDWENHKAVYMPHVENIYQTNGSGTGGTLTITKFDKKNQIISATFSFKAKNQNGEIINITEGRFDKKFTY